MYQETTDGHFIPRLGIVPWGTYRKQQLVER